MDKSMTTNEECKKMVNYFYQLTTFALTMQDEMKSIESAEWDKISSDLLKVSQDMNKLIAVLVVGKICL
jgi:hypothetical protein